jgi:hypothetical protein
MPAMSQSSTVWAKRPQTRRSNMPDVVEYSYETTNHLSPADAAKRYAQAKAQNPTAIIELDELDCGHWTIHVHSSSQDKRVFLARRYQNLVRQALLALLGR